MAHGAFRLHHLLCRTARLWRSFAGVDVGGVERGQGHFVTLTGETEEARRKWAPTERFWGQAHQGAVAEPRSGTGPCTSGSKVCRRKALRGPQVVGVQGNRGSSPGISSRDWVNSPRQKFLQNGLGARQPLLGSKGSGQGLPCHYSSSGAARSQEGARSLRSIVCASGLTPSQQKVARCLAQGDSLRGSESVTPVGSKESLR